MMTKFCLQNFKPRQHKQTTMVNCLNIFELPSGINLCTKIALKNICFFPPFEIFYNFSQNF